MVQREVVNWNQSYIHVRSILTLLHLACDGWTIPRPPAMRLIMAHIRMPKKEDELEDDEKELRVII